MKRKRNYIIAFILICIMIMGNTAYATSELDTPATEIEELRYEILDGITYGLSFSGNQVNCYASLISEYAQKYIVSGMLQKKNSNGYYDYVYTWGEETHNGQTCNWDKYCTAAGDGEYLFTFYVKIYDGNKWESLTFTKYKTR